jgi:hypothetical protein
MRKRSMAGRESAWRRPKAFIALHENSSDLAAAFAKHNLHDDV